MSLIIISCERNKKKKIERKKLMTRLSLVIRREKITG